MELLNLADAPQHLPQLAAWHHAEWSYLNPGMTLAERTAKLSQNAQTPTNEVIIAVEGGDLLGSAALVDHDMDSHLEWSPWLASVYVEASRRNMGIGTALVRRLMALAAEQGHRQIYLFTPDAARFYRALGWQSLDEETYRGESVTTMTALLPAPDQ